MKLDELVLSLGPDGGGAIEKEAVKGYGLVFFGVEQPLAATEQRFDPQLASLIETFDGPVATVLNGSGFRTGDIRPLNILVPTGGAAHSRLATEVAVALAQATGGNVTALHVFSSASETAALRGRANRLGLPVLVDARRLGKRSSVVVETITRVNTSPEMAVQRAASSERFDLVVLGASLRLGQRKFLGPASEHLVRTIKTPILLIAQ